MTNEEFRQFRAFARLDGFYLGVLFTCCFASYIWALKSPAAGLLPLILGIYVPFFAARRLRKFRDEISNGIISFRRALCYSILEFFYASLIMATAIFIYLQFIDNGFIVSFMASELAKPEMKPLLVLYNVTPEMLVSMFAEIRAIDIAFQSITMNLIGGISVSFIIAAIVQRSFAGNRNLNNNGEEES